MKKPSFTRPEKAALLRAAEYGRIALRRGINANKDEDVVHAMVAEERLLTEAMRKVRAT